jgi:predicted transcriptional regulator
MSTTSLELPDELKQRAAAAARHAGFTPHAFMVAAIEQATASAEARAHFVAQAEAARKDTLHTGKGYDAAAVHDPSGPPSLCDGVVSHRLGGARLLGFALHPRSLGPRKLGPAVGKHRPRRPTGVHWTPVVEPEWVRPHQRSPENSLFGRNLQGNAAVPTHVQLGLVAYFLDSS